MLIVFGSKSDYKGPESPAGQCLKLLKQIGINYTVKVASCHRSQPKVEECVKWAINNGTKYVLGIGGLAFHLPGDLRAKLPRRITVAALTTDEVARQSVGCIPDSCGCAEFGVNNGKTAALEIGSFFTNIPGYDGVEFKMKTFLEGEAEKRVIVAEAELHKLLEADNLA